MKAQIHVHVALQINVQSCSQAETFSFIDFFKGPLLSGSHYFQGGGLLSEFCGSKERKKGVVKRREQIHVRTSQLQQR